jgi:AcrR family transcriptional regulator
MVDTTVVGGRRATRGPGRRRDMEPEARRSVILDAALQVFSLCGFRLATMDEVASRVGMSKKTIYSLFPSKLDLFLELLRRSRSRFGASGMACEPDLPLEDRLVSRLCLIADAAFSNEHLALMRLIIGESRQTPELAEAFSREMLNPQPFGIPECLAEAELQGTHRFGEFANASEMLVGMSIGTAHFKTLVSEANRPSAADIRLRIAEAVRLFLAGTAVPVPSTSIASNA